MCNFSRVKNRGIIPILLVIHKEIKGKSQTPIGMDSVKVPLPKQNAYMCAYVHMCV